jgi:murein DD-endopeptidase MepM/ murein hydrolase activator NlpD
MKKLKLFIVILFCSFLDCFAQPYSSLNSNNFEQLLWPVGNQLNEGVFLLMLVDHDQASGIINDYNCNDQYVYDGHTGTDISAYNFHAMDWGIPIYAANDGVVTFLRDDQFDRNYWPPYIGQPNGIIVRHSDGSNSQYWHLRKNSATITVGDSVRKGDIIAMMGSSGSTPIPHLHFELRKNVNGSLLVTDPFIGNCNPDGGLWEENHEYPGSTQFRLLDAGIFNKTDLQGSENNNYFGELYLKDRPTQPTQYGINESKLGLWIQSQIKPGTNYKIVIKKTNGDIFVDQNKTATTKKGVQWHVFYWNFSSQVSTSDYGLWTAEIIQDGQNIKNINFNVGAETIFPPRIFPVSGRSIKINGSEQTVTLLTEYSDDELSFSLIDEPASVSLNENVLTINGESDQEYRNAFFMVRLEDSNGQMDTARFHLVDYSKPFNTNVTNVEEETIAPDDFLVFENYPNPFNPSTTIIFKIAKAGIVHVRIYNELGQEIRELTTEELIAGTHQITWNGKNENGLSVSSGTYFARVLNDNKIKTIKMVLVK